MRSLVLGLMASWVAVSVTPYRNVVDDDEGPIPPHTSSSQALHEAATEPSDALALTTTSYLAPPGALHDETRAEALEQVMAVGDGSSWGPAIRVDAGVLEHIGFHLAVDPPTARVELEVLSWSGTEASSLGVTNWGPGLRVLAALDPTAPRTFWVRARGSISSGVMTVTRTQLDDGSRCSRDCDQLLQLPLPLEPSAQGYEIAPSSVYAYLFGRRDLLTALFHAGQVIADEGFPPFQVKRLSRWDGGQPPSHRSHVGGVDVDISLYTADGHTVWYPLCRDAGSRCVRGTRWNFGHEQMALLIAGFFESGLFETGGGAFVLLDRELHRGVRIGADALHERGAIEREIHELFSFRHALLRHVEPHHHHVHIRIGDP